MAEIINLETKESTSSDELKNPQSVRLLNNINKVADEFSDVLIFYKKEDNSFGLLDTGISLELRCFINLILQSQIQRILTSEYTSFPISSDDLGR